MAVATAPPDELRTLDLEVTGMSCASCVRRVEVTLAAVDGVSGSVVNLATNTARVTGNMSTASVIAAVQSAGYTATPKRRAGTATVHAHRAGELADLFLAATLTVPVILITMLAPQDVIATRLTLLVLTLPIWIWAGRRFHLGALAGLRFRSANMDTLVSLGTTTAFIASAIEAIANTTGPLYFDSVGVIITLILTGRYLEGRARHRAGASLERLAALQPSEATVLIGENTVTIPTIDLGIGDLLLVRPGSRVPADGQIVRGRANIDESMVTGESVPVERTTGDSVLTGTVAVDGALTVRVDRIGEDTTLAHIISLVEAAQLGKAPAQRLADRVAGIFVPVIIALAALTAIAWAASGHSATTAAVTAVSVLVVACPCALGLATPTAILVATGVAADQGIVISSIEALEHARTVNAVLFDKTGTLTTGEFEVCDSIVVKDGGSPPATSTFWRVLSAAESGSQHPIAKALVRHAETLGVKPQFPEVLEVMPGGGVRTRVGDHEVLVGPPDGLAPENAYDSTRSTWKDRGYTDIAVTVDGSLWGFVALLDSERAGAAVAVQALVARGLDVEMLTGDSPQAAQRVATNLGIKHALSRMTPVGKWERVRDLQSHGKLIAFVGDGVNDAPVLTQADVGIALGSGTDIAAHASDVTLVNSDLNSIGRFFAISAAAHRTMVQNLVWASLYNAVLVPAAMFGFVNPMLAAGAMAMSSVSVVANALRLRRQRL